MFRRGFLLALLSIALFGHAAMAQNCCLPRLGDDDQSTKLFNGIYLATGVMLAALFSMAVFGLTWYRLRFGIDDIGIDDIDIGSRDVEA